MTFLFLLGTQAVGIDDPISGLSLLVGNTINQFSLTADATGAASVDLSIPPNPSLVGMNFYLQAGSRGTLPMATHGLQTVICP